MILCKIVGLGVLLFFVLLGVVLVVEEFVLNSGDIVWMLIFIVFVLFMIIFGLVLFYGGMV